MNGWWPWAFLTSHCKMFDTRPSKSLDFVKHRPTVLDELPLDVIREYIFPKLDYESRMNLNLCLPPWDRLSKKMDRASVETHDRLTATYVVKRYLEKLEWVWEVNSRDKLCTKMFSLFFKPRYKNLARYNLGFRTVLLEKLDSLKGQQPYRGQYADINIRTRLLKTMKRLKKAVENAPYEGEVLDKGEPLVFV